MICEWSHDCQREAEFLWSPPWTWHEYLCRVHADLIESVSKEHIDVYWGRIVHRGKRAVA